MTCVLTNRMDKRTGDITTAFLNITLICPVNCEDRHLATKRT